MQYEALIGLRPVISVVMSLFFILFAVHIYDFQYRRDPSIIQEM